MMSLDKKLKKLFDYQRFENEEKLQGVIDNVNKNVSNVRALSDDELIMAAGGTEISIPDQISESTINRCGKCDTALIKKSEGKYCMKCHSYVDDNGFPITI